MRKILFSLLLLVSITAMAKEKQDDSKYLTGAVPEVNGIVTFKKSFSVSAKSAEEINTTMREFVNGLVKNSISAPGNFARIIEDENGRIVARVCEWMVFKKKALVLDRARFRYQIEVTTEGNHVGIVITNLTYYYYEDMETQNGIIFKAEEWISDKEALNKAGTKLYPKSGKFRRKTVDRMEEIFDTIMDNFEEEEVAPTKPVRRNIIEE